MKKFMQFCMAAMVLVVFAACNGDLDPRDAFVGAYSYQTAGSVDFYYGSMQVLNLPLDESGTFTISKADGEKRVVIVGYNDSIYATVSGNELALEATEYNTNYNGIDLHMVFTYGKAKLAGNRLTWDTDVQGTAQYMGFNINGNGSVSMTADKNKGK